jgi:hypothetical protein
MFGLKAALDEAAKYLSMKLVGNSTFTQLFRCAVVPISDQPLLMINNKPVTADDPAFEQEWINAHVDGNRNGSGKRVPRAYPIFRDWTCPDVEFEILDPRITEEIFLKHMAACGVFKGIGRFRPGNGGFNGRFEVIHNGKTVPTSGLTIREDTISDDEPAPAKRTKKAAKLETADVE